MDKTKKNDNFLMRLLKGKYNNPWLVKLFIVCLLIIPLTVFCIFVIYGNFGGIIEAFKVKNGTTWYWGVENFKFLYDPFNPEHGLLASGTEIYISNSFGYLFVFMFISVPISIGCSFFLYKKVPFSKMIVVLLFLPNIIPGSVLGLYYRELVIVGIEGSSGGVLYEAFKAMGLNVSLTNSYTGNLYLYIYTVYFGFGYNAILIWGAMTRIPEEVVESANLDGANLITEFFKITVPMSWATMSMVIVLSWMVPFTVYSQPMMIIGASNKETMTWAQYVMNIINPPAGSAAGESNTYMGAAYSVFAACISLPTTLLLQKALDKVYPAVEV